MRLLTRIRDYYRRRFVAERLLLNGHDWRVSWITPQEIEAYCQTCCCCFVVDDHVGGNTGWLYDTLGKQLEAFTKKYGPCVGHRIPRSCCIPYTKAFNEYVESVRS